MASWIYGFKIKNKKMFKFLYLCWKSFTKGDYWIYFGSSLVLGLPFIQCFSVFFELPFKTGNFNCRQVLLLGLSWLFFLLVSELANMKFNNKFYYNHGNIYWGLIGFSIALFLMR